MLELLVFVSLKGAAWRGAAAGGGAIYTWGTGVQRWDVATRRRHSLARAVNGGFGEGGCVDREGTVYLQDGVDRGPLVTISRSGRRTVWDAEVEMHNCIATTLLGHTGVLMTDHYNQVRLYERPGVYQEVYSFYTASNQTGLALTDVDHDGLPDIFCGNYWIRSPREFELPWRLFAINLYHRSEWAAAMTVAADGQDLVAAQGHLAAGKLFHFTRPSNPEQLWPEVVVAELHYPHAVLAAQASVFVAENNGQGSGLFRLTQAGLERIASTGGVHTLIEAAGHIYAVGSDSILRVQ